MSLIRRALFWFKAARPQFFTGAIVPVLVGGALAYHDTGVMLWGYLLLTALGVIFIHAAANLANDYYDHLSGNDAANTEFARPFTGGSRVIQDGKAEPKAVLLAAMIYLALGSLIGLYLFWMRGWPILLLGLIGGLSGIFYTARPLQLGYRGFGEIFIGLDFGVLPVLGSYYVQTQHFSLPALMASLPVAFTIMVILWINQFQDYAADKAVNKLHWVVRLGRRRASYVYTGMIAATFLSIILSVIGGLLPPLALIALGAMPVGVMGIKTALLRYDDIPRLTPANAATVLVHLLTGLLLSAGLAADKILKI